MGPKSSVMRRIPLSADLGIKLDQPLVSGTQFFLQSGIDIVGYLGRFTGMDSLRQAWEIFVPEIDIEIGADFGHENGGTFDDVVHENYPETLFGHMFAPIMNNLRII